MEEWEIRSYAESLRARLAQAEAERDRYMDRELVLQGQAGDMAEEIERAQAALATARRDALNEVADRCDCDAAETWHGLHATDCAYIRWVDAGVYENGLRGVGVAVTEKDEQR